MNSFSISWLRLVSALGRFSGRLFATLFLVGLGALDARADLTQTVRNIINSTVSDIDVCQSRLDLASDRLIDAIQSLESFATEDSFASTNELFNSAWLNVDRAYTDISYAQSRLSRSKANLQQIDLSGLDQNVCTNCDAKLDEIIYKLDSNSDKLDSNSAKLDALYLATTNIDRQVEQLDYAINAVSNLIYDTSAGGGGSDSSGGSSGCGCADLLSQILAVLQQVRSDLYDVKLDVHKYADGLMIYVNWFNAISDEVQTYYKLLNERYNHWDGRLTSNLRNLYNETKSRIDIVTDRFLFQTWSLDDALSIALDEGNDSTLGPIKLSNEGYIGLQSLILQERQYLTELDIANALRYLTNGIFSTGMTTNDLAWAMRYYMDYNDNFYRVSAIRQNPFAPPDYYQAVSNFYGANFNTSDGRFNLGLQRSRYREYITQETNWFNRVELYLMNMNGLLLPSDNLSDVEEASSESAISHAVDRATNQWNSVFSSIASSSNQMSRVVNSFTELLESFHLEAPQGGQYIVIIPDTTFFGVEWQGLSVSPSELDNVVLPVREIFTYLWYIAFALFGFKLLLQFLYICGKLIAQTIYIISQFMGGS